VPELVEIEAYRRLADRVVGRTIAKVDAPDAWWIKDDNSARSLQRALKGATITATRRIGKLLLLDTDGPTIGLRFGMTGRLVVDGMEGVDDLIYSSKRKDPAWDRFGLRFVSPKDGFLRVNDPRRLGGVSLNPDESALGPDALTVSLRDFRVVLDSGAPVKARLMDQAKLAGVGNLTADEALWRAGVDPRREARALTADEQKRLHRHVVKTLKDLDTRGGSHTGDVIEHRTAGGRCPKDGAEMIKATVGGRTTWWCPKHQS
jgi:formamidopyrimidine-DNA glycosylase